jgi:hypothetical protein
MKTLVLAAVCLSAMLALGVEAQRADAAVSIESSSDSPTPTERRVTIEPVMLGSLNFAPLCEGDSAVLVIKASNISQEPLTLQLATTVTEEATRAAFSAESTAPQVVYAPLVVEWLDGDLRVKEQRVPLADMVLAPGGSATLTLGVTAPERAGTYAVRLTIDNWNLSEDSPQTHFRWTHTLPSIAVAAGPLPDGFTVKPKPGYVPDRATAVSIAKAVWYPIYGKDKIDNEQPFSAKLHDGVWTVEGSLPEGMLGGVAEIDISKDDGKVLRVSHGQ